MTELRHVFAAAAAAVGYESRQGPHDFAAAAAQIELPSSPRYVVVLIDGMGFEQLQTMRGHVPFLRNRHNRQLASTFPSTTACAITSFATGYGPGETGMTGYSARDPETGQRIQLLSFLPDVVQPESWQPMPTIAQRAIHGGTMVAIGPEKFRDSGLTRAAWRGIENVYAQSLPQRVDATLAQLRAGAKLVYLYWAELDHVGHGYGWQSQTWAGELERVDAALGELARRLPRDCGLVITADHGMVDIRQRLDIADFPGASQVMTVGEERMLQLFFHPDADAAALQTQLSQWCAPAAQLWTGEQVVSAFAPISDAVQPRIGDCALVAEADFGISDSRWMSVNQRRLIGSHGSVTSAEVAVPLVVELN